MSFNGQAGPIKTTTLLLEIPVVTMAALEKAAAKKGFKPKHYALMIWEAGFAARVGIDRGQTPLDRELDEQVRLVFAHAGQGTPAAIGRAIGMPADRVERILAAWQHAAGDPACIKEDPEPYTPERPSISDESSPEAGPQAEASLAGTGTGTLAGREGRHEGEAASAGLPTIPEAKASEDNGATVQGCDDAEPADSVTGDASRPDEGRTSSATVEDMTVTSSGGENPAPISAAGPAVVPPRREATSVARPIPSQAKDKPKAPAPDMVDLTPRQQGVFAELARRIANGDTVHTDEIAKATGYMPSDVAGAVKTLMGRALISRSAGRFTLTSRGASFAAALLDRAA